MNVDVVAILQSDTLAQVLKLARPLSASVFDVADLMEHPLETGATIADHIVYKPVEIDMPLTITDVQVFADLRQLYRDATLLTVQTRTGSYENMVLVQIPHEETPEAIDTVTAAVRFRQATFVTPAYGGAISKKTTSKPAAASTVKRGAQQTATPPAAVAAKGSVLYNLSGLGK